MPSARGFNPEETRRTKISPHLIPVGLKPCLIPCKPAGLSWYQRGVFNPESGAGLTIFPSPQPFPAFGHPPQYGEGRGLVMFPASLPSLVSIRPFGATRPPRRDKGRGQRFLFPPNSIRRVRKRFSSRMRRLKPIRSATKPMQKTTTPTIRSTAARMTD
jgi:hypothetical protein